MAKKKSTNPPADDQEFMEQDVPAIESDDVDGSPPLESEGEKPDPSAEGEDTPPVLEEQVGPPDVEPPNVVEEAEGAPSDETLSPDEGADTDIYETILRERSGADAEDDPPLILDTSPKSGESDGPEYSPDDLLLLSEEGGDAGHEDSGEQEKVPPSPPSNDRRARVLTIDARDEIQTEAEREATIWHEIQNSYRTRRILTGTLDGVEKTDSGLTLAVVNYKGFRVAIPVKEMMLYTGKTPSGREFMELMDRLNRILNSRLGSEIDFIVKGYDNDSRSVVASRREAMLRKRQTFYLDTDELGEHMIYEGRVVQARVVAVAEKVIRVEVFGVECSIVARGLSWEWIGNARDHFSVGDRILVRVLRIDRVDLEHLSIRVDVRSVSATNSHDNLKKCMPQCRYAGRVTDVRNGVVFIRLNNGVNAIAHSCYDLRTPGKKDDVSFAVTRLDEEQGVAVGIITRIIKQNL